MQVTNHSNNIRNMKEELLEAIYGTVERLGGCVKTHFLKI